MSHPYDCLSVPHLPGRMLFTPCPGTRDAGLDEALATLKAAGATALVTLMPGDELAANGVSDIADRCHALGLDWFQLPVADEHAPLADFDAQWLADGDRITALLREGRDIAIHCKGGSGRTGLIAARLLIALGLPRAEAVARVQALRPKALQHPVHQAWIARFDPPVAP